MNKRALVTAVVILLLLPSTNQPVEATTPPSPGREDPAVTQIVRDYIAASVAGDTAALTAMYVEEIRNNENIDEGLAAEGESLALGASAS